MRKNFAKLFFFTLFWAACILPAHALVDPESPDYIGAFQARSQPFRQAFEQQSSTVGMATEGQKFLEFLDQEMQTAYAMLSNRLDASGKQDLQAAQNAWQAHYKQESVFIENQWTRQRFGTSYVLSRFNHLSRLKELRIRSLLGYLSHFSESDEGSK